ncbi:unnamed protein product [Heligmosomoides polygyrus]|uniref:G_PROTEIN_RECEP_F1_2 domain-containing protein n=1 Tax=Heligmosomoides polygyrus TaxID=6339 RepID=A0A183FST8_HELPZ|nr:unnamed protein product [Heligmosomoides polygyrus]
MSYSHLLVTAHLVLLILSVWLICEAGSLNFSGIRIPGLDGFPPFELHHGSVSHNEVDPKESTLYVSASRTIEKPSLGTSRNVVSGLGYLYLLSTLMGLISLKTIDGVWRPDGLSPSSCATRVLLIPFLLSMVSLGGGIFLWTFRNIRVQILAINENQVDRSTSLIIADSVRFTFLPCVIVWAVYLYFIYGCLLSFVFICRRSKHWYLQKNGTGTVNSSSWSFRAREPRHNEIESTPERTLLKRALRDQKASDKLSPTGSMTLPAALSVKVLRAAWHPPSTVAGSVVDVSPKYL